MPSLFVLPRQVPLSSAAALMAGAKAYFYQTGTSTPQNTYSDILLTTPNANPVVADANGVFGKIYLDPSLPNYRLTLKTSADVTLYTEDDIPSNQNTAQQFRLKATAPSLTFQDTDGTADHRVARLYLNGGSLFVSLFNDAESIETPISSVDLTTGIWTFNTNRLNVGVNRVITGESGTFTGTLTGMSTTTTGTINYHRSGGFVALTVPSALNATSNSTSMTLTGLPNAIQLSNHHSGFCLLRDNGADLQAGAFDVQGSVVTFYKLSGAAYSASGFTSSGSKGLPANFTMIYRTDSDPF